MKRVLIVCNTLYGGGAEAVLQTVLNNINIKKYDITLYSMNREEIDKKVYKNDFHYKAVFNHKDGFFSSMYEIHNKIKGIIFMKFSSNLFYKLYIRGKFDIEIAFIEGESTKIVSGSNNKKSKKLAWVHIDLEKNPWTSFLYNGIEDETEHYNCFDKIVCVSNATKEAFCRKYKTENVKIITHYNPINVDLIKRRSMEYINNSYFSHDNNIEIIAVGRLVKQKGFDRLLEAAKDLSQLGYRFHLHIVGDGKEKVNLSKCVLNNNMEEYVTLHGYQNNPYKYMSHCDILICSSRAEGYSLVIAEAMTLGLAIVTTKCSGPCELVDNGKYGVLVENSTKGILNGLEYLIKNEEDLIMYKKLAKKRSCIFNLERNISELEKIIDE